MRKATKRHRNALRGLRGPRWNAAEARAAGSSGRMAPGRVGGHIHVIFLAGWHCAAGVMPGPLRAEQRSGVRPVSTAAAAGPAPSRRAQMLRGPRLPQQPPATAPTRRCTHRSPTCRSSLPCRNQPHAPQPQRPAAARRARCPSPQHWRPRRHPPQRPVHPSQPTRHERRPAAGTTAAAPAAPNRRGAPHRSAGPSRCHGGNREPRC